jgi:hypothetical protein
MPYLSSRKHNHTESHFRRSSKSHGAALTAVLLLLSGAALVYCGVTLFGALTAA